jgi:hypothetical protein
MVITKSKRKAPMSEALYRKVCQPAFKRIEDAVAKSASVEDVKRVEDKIDELAKSINVGNGQPSLRSQITSTRDDVDGLITLRNWCMGIVATLVVLLGTIMIYDWLAVRDLPKAVSVTTVK